MAQLVKDLPAMQKNWVRSLGWDDPMEKGKATHSSILAWRSPWTIPWGCKESDTTKKLGLRYSSNGKESACNAGDLHLIPGSGRSPGEGKSYSFQYSGLENSMD